LKPPKKGYKNENLGLEMTINSGKETNLEMTVDNGQEMMQGTTTAPGKEMNPGTTIDSGNAKNSEMETDNGKRTKLLQTDKLVEMEMGMVEDGITLHHPRPLAETQEVGTIALHTKITGEIMMRDP
jgi:hypothetical protein